MATTLTSKGQVTIPKSVRDHLGLKSGHAVEFELRKDGCVVVRPAGRRIRRRTRFARLVGSARTRLRTDEIMALTRG